jgi:hypothetical protein
MAGDRARGEVARLMAGGSSRVLARIFSTHDSEYASLTWEWILRADGQVRYRLTQLRGKRERNPWQPVTQISGRYLLAFTQGTASAEPWLAGLALKSGHHVDGYGDRAHEQRDR